MESKTQNVQSPYKTSLITRSRIDSSSSQLSYVSDHSKEIRKRGRPKKKSVQFHSVVRVKLENQPSSDESDSEQWSHLEEVSDIEDISGLIDNTSETETELSYVEPIRLTLDSLRVTYSRLKANQNSPPGRVIVNCRLDIANLSTKREETLS